MIGSVDISATVGNQRHPVDHDDQVEIDAMTAITFSLRGTGVGLPRGRVSSASLDRDIGKKEGWHFHADHISSLRDFARAEIITCGEAARRVTGMSAAAALRHGIFKELLPPDFAQRLRPLQGMTRVPTDTVLGEGYDLFADSSYLAVPLPGHAFGHFGVFWRDQAGPVIYATDASWTIEALTRDQTPWISSAYVFDDRRAGRQTQQRLREFQRQGGRVLLCHDVEDERS